jgi:hypothetical protein
MSQIDFSSLTEDQVRAAIRSAENYVKSEICDKIEQGARELAAKKKKKEGEGWDDGPAEGSSATRRESVD